ncbi:hypothetical protein BCR36DRAFT_453923 [Piromyces finnis]|uniref:Uncharacterized protein n=1 Tax=Piromyces finnis TaxID=1754191 RepID=A0A1Y1VMZ2_9FUNG|nr:hypothetical protein BCR36DRAFT_453923 [Piromyces finnis]|eukprot:ORX59264.1 hypothetical protein BCR36DRAFT_453923 [Piromyces finnis]
MKFTFLLFALLFIIITNANSVIISSVFKRDDLGNNGENLLSQECLEEDINSEYSNECMTTIININNYKEKCLVFKSEKCQTFYNDPDLSKYYPICTKDEQSKKVYNRVVFQSLINNVLSKCYMDENDELCPLSLFRITQPNSPIDYPVIINDTCKSKKCTDSFIEYMNKRTLESYSAYEELNPDHKFSYDELNLPKQIISELEFEECKSMHITSNAITIVNNYNIIFLFLFLLLLLIC